MAGLMYSLVAMGIVLIYKSSSVPNLAQGALTMLGAYVVLAFAARPARADVGGDPARDGCDVRRGIGIERVALRRLAGRPIMMILMMTLGLDIFLRGDRADDVRRQRPADADRHQRRAAVPRPDPAEPQPMPSAPRSRCVLFGLFVLFFRTRRGIVLRAISDDYTASWSVGISVERGVALSWALSSVAATTAGVLWGSVQGVDQSLSMLLLKGVTVAVLGGMDSIGGAIARRPRCSASSRASPSGYLDPLVGGGTPRPGRRGGADPDDHDPPARPVRPPRHRTDLGAPCCFARPASATPNYAGDRALFPMPVDRVMVVGAAAARRAPRR